MHESAQKGETRPSSQQLRTLLEVAEAIISNRELSAMFKNLASLLHRVARFDHLWLNLCDGAGDTLRLNVMEPANPGGGRGASCSSRSSYVGLAEPATSGHFFHKPGRTVA
jgi:hypothetical protein